MLVKFIIILLSVAVISLSASTVELDWSRLFATMTPKPSIRMADGNGDEKATVIGVPPQRPTCPPPKVFVNGKCRIITSN
jgi:hypothetical protein